MKNKRIDSSLLMGKGQADALINKINVLIPKVMPPLLLGYVIWNQSVVAEIYKSIQEYTIETLNSLEPLQVELEQIAQRMGEADCTRIEINMIKKGLIEAAQRAKAEIEQQTAVTMPEVKIPQKIALWIAGILLAVAIASINKSSDDQ